MSVNAIAFSCFVVPARVWDLDGILTSRQKYVNFNKSCLSDRCNGGKI